MNRYDGFVSKSVYACTSEGDWCKNHGSATFDVDRLRLKKKKKKKKQKHEEMSGLVVFCQNV